MAILKMKIERLKNELENKIDVLAVMEKYPEYAWTTLGLLCHLFKLNSKDVTDDKKKWTTIPVEIRMKYGLIARHLSNLVAKGEIRFVKKGRTKFFVLQNAPIKNNS